MPWNAVKNGSPTLIAASSARPRPTRTVSASTMKSCQRSIGAVPAMARASPVRCLKTNRARPLRRLEGELDGRMRKVTQLPGLQHRAVYER